MKLVPALPMRYLRCQLSKRLYCLLLHSRIRGGDGVRCAVPQRTCAAKYGNFALEVAGTQKTRGVILQPGSPWLPFCRRGVPRLLEQQTCRSLTCNGGILRQCTLGECFHLFRCVVLLCDARFFIGELRLLGGPLRFKHFQYSGPVAQGPCCRRECRKEHVHVCRSTCTVHDPQSHCVIGEVLLDLRQPVALFDAGAGLSFEEVQLGRLSRPTSTEGFDAVEESRTELAPVSLVVGVETLLLFSNFLARMQTSNICLTLASCPGRRSLLDYRLRRLLQLQTFRTNQLL